MSRLLKLLGAFASGEVFTDERHATEIVGPHIGVDSVDSVGVAVTVRLFSVFVKWGPKISCTSPFGAKPIGTERCIFDFDAAEPSLAFCVAVKSIF